MRFEGRLYFDFISPEVFRFYQLLVAAEREGAELALEWRGFPAGPGAGDRKALAASELVRIEAPRRHGGFVQAVLVAVADGADAADPALLPVAARAAGLDPAQVDAKHVESLGEGLLDHSTAEAADLGVTGVPTIYRHGPAVKIRTTPAVRTGSAVRRLELIDAMLEDDGLWELSKP